MNSGGNLFILFAPHIGICRGCHLGRYSRDGQTHEGTACGAAVAAFQHCRSGGFIPDAPYLGANPYDYQMQYFISEISKRVQYFNDSKSDNENQAELARQMYNIVKVMFNLLHV